MRFGRIILAGLAPLLGLSALAAIAAGAGDGGRGRADADSLVRLLRTVVHLATPDAEYSAASASPERSSPQAVLAVTALVATPLRRSVWMVTGPGAFHAVPRPRRRELLRL